MSNLMNFNSVIRLHRLATDPSSGQNGSMYYNTTTNKVRAYVNGGWADVATGVLNYANQTLSNLGTTAINASLLPDTSNAYDLGSTAKYWTNLYATSIFGGSIEVTNSVKALFIESQVAAPSRMKLTLPGGTISDASDVVIIDVIGKKLQDSSGLASVDWQSRILKNAAGTSIFDWSSATFGSDVSMGSHKLTNVTDPTSAQDAATKHYVDTASPVLSVNSKTGVVVLNTDDVGEGTTNLYFTSARAKAAAVANSITSGVTDVAPSQDAVFSALALKAPLASPALTGSPTAPTQSPLDNSTKIATTAYVDAAVSAAAPVGYIKADGTVPFTGAQSMGGFKLTNVATPTSGTDAVNKNYVDGLIEGIKPKEAVQVATTVDITLSGLQTIDGYTVVAGDRVLVKDQSLPAQNGIYVAASGAWSRSLDMDAASEFKGSYVAVIHGSAAGKLFVCSSTVVTIGTDPVNFIFFNSQALLTAGSGIDITGTTISVNNTVVRTNGANAFTADQSMGGFALTNVLDPVNAQDAATKHYVDNAAGNGANKSLSNLTATAINASLIAGTNNAYDLGSSSFYWNNTYATNMYAINIGSEVGVPNKMGISLAAAQIYAGSALSIDTGNRGLVASNSFTSLNWDEKALYNNSGVLTVDWGLTVLKAANSIQTVDWGNGLLNDVSAGVLAVNWGSRFLADSVGTTSVDWEHRQLTRADGTLAIDWQSNALLTAGNSVLTWNGSGVKVFSSLFIGLTGLTEGTIIDYSTAILTANISSPSNIATLGFSSSLYRSVVIEYSCREATTNAQRTGTIILATDGTNVTMNDMSTDTAMLGAGTGLEFSAVMNGTDVEIHYNNTGSYAITLKVMNRRFQA